MVAGPADLGLAGRGWRGLIFIPERGSVQPPSLSAGVRLKWLARTRRHQGVYVEEQGPAGRMSLFIYVFKKLVPVNVISSINESDLASPSYR